MLQTLSTTLRSNPLKPIPSCSKASGVFSSRCRYPASSRESHFHRARRRDSLPIVTPFVRSGTSFRIFLFFRKGSDYIFIHFWILACSLYGVSDFASEFPRYCHVRLHEFRFHRYSKCFKIDYSTRGQVHLPGKELRYLRTIHVCYSAHDFFRDNSPCRHGVRTISSKHIIKYALRFGM
jgi:hypothetical protein